MILFLNGLFLTNTLERIVILNIKIFLCKVRVIHLNKNTKLIESF